MSEFNCHTALEVSGPYHQVQRFFEEYFSFEADYVRVDDEGAALDLDLACPIPAALKGTDVPEAVKQYHAVHLMPAQDLRWAPFIYREGRSRRIIEARLEALHPREVAKIRQAAIRLHHEVYHRHGALDESDWSWRFRGCFGNSYCRRGGQFAGDDRGVALRCSFNTEIGWPRPVLERLARSNTELWFRAEVETWAGEKSTFHGAMGRAEVRQLIPPLQEHAVG